jgi:hypothetical protein
MEWIVLAIAMIVMAPAAFLPFLLQAEQTSPQRVVQPTPDGPTPLFPRRATPSGGIDAAAA